jgi:hypothetical protein
MIGFAVGFLFSAAVIDRLVDFFQSGSTALPAQIPSIIDLVLGGGAVGIFIFMILILLGIKTVKVFATFATWLIVGILFSMILAFLGIVLPMPDFIPTF